MLSTRVFRNITLIINTNANIFQVFYRLRNVCGFYLPVKNHTCFYDGYNSHMHGARPLLQTTECHKFETLHFEITSKLLKRRRRKRVKRHLWWLFVKLWNQRETSQLVNLITCQTQVLNPTPNQVYKNKMREFFKFIRVNWFNS